MSLMIIVAPQSAVSFRIVFKLLDDYMLSPTENHLKMIDANVFVLVFFLYNSPRFLPQTQLKGTRMFQTFRGSPALSEFRIQGLMQKFQQNQLPVKSVYAEYLHFVELNRPLASEQEAKLKALLHYGPTLAEHDAKGETFIVIPRVWHDFFLVF